MPELPEVETTRRGIAPALAGQHIGGVIVRDSRLRWPVPADLGEAIRGKPILGVRRRGKYLLIDLPDGSLLIHLGMSGSLRVVDPAFPLAKHDHVDLLLSGGRCLRFHDPRRFGAVLWAPGNALEHPLMRHLGPEPFDPAFHGDYLWRSAHASRRAIKLVLMDGQIVVGVGNIYANEALFRAGIRPARAANRLTRKESDLLVATVRDVLTEAIAAGGSTLRDFVDSEGKPGYFQQRYFVYGRGAESCLRCQSPIAEKKLGQRATFWCPQCQR
ncbi:bifunctional DNA-formamidopyrimidine glycosylase/DNA-(apurinic or apyrimidinic site) lyase [Chitinimonas sp. BJYL2]|uniref:bifunctional DNA-formamidopyrimidine glycosylase/DNA-(apurinic or apyrimidinic site) lyase n=1 Tax=Chitinimonas sp. BJYL2 TaxID=2976696 RepID=UPI0022B41F8E|nr:bifunctional DNA-formamidopyrimidine glycosylase/DNA-(apurinic or apyrimidinic site) lyase [Chitinimonas sp. BJYL2]